MKYLLPFILLIPIATIAQTQLPRYDTFAGTTTSVSGIGNLVQIIPNATVAVYYYPGAGTSCSGGGCTAATTYTSRTGVTACGGGLPITRPTSPTCFSTADISGNFGFWAPAGAYQYCISATNVTTQCYNIVLGTTVNANGFSGSDLGAQIQNADTSCGTGIPCQIQITASGTISEAPVTLNSQHDLVCIGDQVTLTMAATAFISQASNTRIKNCAFISTQTTQLNGEIFSQGTSNLEAENLTFTGGGRHIQYNTVSKARILRYRAISITAAAPSNNMIECFQCDHSDLKTLRLEGFVIPTGSAPMDAINVHNSNYVNVDDVIAQDIDATQVQGGCAVCVTGSTFTNVSNIVCSRLDNMDCVATQGGSTDVGIWNVTSFGNSSYVGAGANANNGDCLDIFQSARVHLSNNQCRGNGRTGLPANQMEIFSDYDVTVQGSDLSDSGSNIGLVVAGTVRARVIGVTANRNWERGLLVQADTGTVSTGTNCAGVNTVCYLTGNQFGPNWPVNSAITVNALACTVASVQSGTQLTVNASSCTVGNNASVNYSFDSVDVQVIGGTFNDNGQGVLGSQRQTGIDYTGAASGIVIGATATDTRASGTKTQSYGIEFDNTARAPLLNNNFRGNNTGTVNDTVGNTPQILDDGSSSNQQIQVLQVNSSASFLGKAVIYNSLVTSGNGVGSVQAATGAVTIGSGTSIAATSLCSTSLCPAGRYQVNVYIDITIACTTTGTYIPWLAWTDDQGAKTGSSTTTYFSAAGGLGVTPATATTGATLGLASTANFLTGTAYLTTTGAATGGLGSINYGTTATACGTGGPMVGKMYLSVLRLE